MLIIDVKEKEKQKKGNEDHLKTLLASWLHVSSLFLKNLIILLDKALPTYPISLDGSCKNLICNNHISH